MVGKRPWAAAKYSLVDLWAIQESLLQNYRNLLIVVQSIFVAATLSFLSSDTFDPIHYSLAFVIAIYTNCLWINLCHDRGLSVLFLQTLVRRQDEPDRFPDNEYKDRAYFHRLRLFQDDEAYRIFEWGQPDFIKPDNTRNSLNFVLPVMFLFFWIYNSVRLLWQGRYEIGHFSVTTLVVPSLLSILALGYLLYNSVRRKDLHCRIPFKRLFTFSVIAAISLHLFS